MKSIPITACLLLALHASACRVPSASQTHGSGNMWVGEAMRRAQVEEAIVVQRAVQPYHFLAESAELNELGELELGVLAGRYLSAPGTLSVRRGGAAEDLYEARVARVVEFLGAAGLEPGAVEITDGWPGGDGMPSTRVNDILKASHEAAGTVGVGTPQTGEGQ